MTNDQIKEIALVNGFKLKGQPSGEMDLNPYAYEFARALIDEHAKTDSITDIRNWFKAAKPEPTDRDVCTQIGCHFEEVSEMNEAILGVDTWEIDGLANHFKYASKLPKDADKIELLDALCDQIVTATGVAYMMGFDIESALKEVIRSNNSKMVGGKFEFDANGKIAKPESYSEPDLTPFIK